MNNKEKQTNKNSYIFHKKFHKKLFKILIEVCLFLGFRKLHPKQFTFVITLLGRTFAHIPAVSNPDKERSVVDAMLDWFAKSLTTRRTTRKYRRFNLFPTILGDVFVDRTRHCSCPNLEAVIVLLNHFKRTFF